MFTDNYDNRLILDDSSMEVYELDVYSDGSVDEGSLVDDSDYTVEHDTDNHQIKLTFKNEIDSAYRIQYVTDIDPDKIDSSETEFDYVNDASFNGLSDSDTVHVERGSLVEKEGESTQDFNSDAIDWTITMNKALMS